MVQTFGAVAQMEAVVTQHGAGGAVGVLLRVGVHALTVLPVQHWLVQMVFDQATRLYKGPSDNGVHPSTHPCHSVSQRSFVVAAAANANPLISKSVASVRVFCRAKTSVTGKAFAII